VLVTIADVLVQVPPECAAAHPVEPLGADTVVVERNLGASVVRECLDRPVKAPDVRVGFRRRVVLELSRFAPGAVEEHHDVVRHGLLRHWLAI
jgi:hypothetical protein